MSTLGRWAGRALALHGANGGWRKVVVRVCLLNSYYTLVLGLYHKRVFRSVTLCRNRQAARRRFRDVTLMDTTAPARAEGQSARSSLAAVRFGEVGNIGAIEGESGINIS